MAKSFSSKGRADGTQSQRTQEISHFVKNEFTTEFKKKERRRMNHNNDCMDLNQCQLLLLPTIKILRMFFLTFFSHRSFNYKRQIMRLIYTIQQKHFHDSAEPSREKNHI